MRKNVLIYGFGWTGKAALELCEDMGCECKIIDKRLICPIILDGYNKKFLKIIW